MKKFNISFSKNSKGILGISGHVGVGHVHSHSGFVQDDSAGFAVVASILKKALPVDTAISKVTANVITGEILVQTNGGGIGKALPRRGIAPFEAELMIERAIGLNAVFSQAAAVKVFGRIYGQGVSETATAFQGACALAALDTFVKAAPGKFKVMTEKLPDKLDTAAATVIDVEGIPISIMLVINFTEGGIGPDEDYEGNTMWADKGRIMKEVGLDKIPTVVVESKAYIPSMAENVDVEKIYIRAQENIDDMNLGEHLVNAAKQNNIPYHFSKTAMPLLPGSLQKATIELADRIIALARELKKVDSAIDKVQIIAELVRLVSEDAGGITFMSNSLHDKVRGAGLVPGTGAVISMIVSKKYIDFMKIPILTMEDVDKYITVILEGLLNYAKRNGEC
ncbi:MAG: hypothetical protein ACPLRZ_00755 [Thermovenabulum sp.]|uniref:hypothetical protein n=1 Tax=Thermovenabulum sp. TaxID=3100335 RepID=UPI003C7C7211